MLSLLMTLETLPCPETYISIFFSSFLFSDIGLVERSTVLPPCRVILCVALPLVILFSGVFTVSKLCDGSPSFLRAVFCLTFPGAKSARSSLITWFYPFFLTGLLDLILLQALLLWSCGFLCDPSAVNWVYCFLNVVISLIASDCFLYLNLPNGNPCLASESSRASSFLLLKTFVRVGVLYGDFFPTTTFFYFFIGLVSPFFETGVYDFTKFWLIVKSSSYSFREMSWTFLVGVTTIYSSAIWAIISLGHITS